LLKTGNFFKKECSLKDQKQKGQHREERQLKNELSYKTKDLAVFYIPSIGSALLLMP